MRRSVLILVFFLGLPAALGAQTQQGSWSNLNRVKAGQGIERRRLRLEDRFLGFLARNWRPCWRRDWGPKRGSGRRRAPRPPAHTTVYRAAPAAASH